MRWGAHLRCFFFIVLFALAVLGHPRPSAAQNCPTDRDKIDSDRPSTTDSPRTVPQGSFQAENGVNWTAGNGPNVFTAAETRLRFGVARCFELVLDAPSYFLAMNGPAPSGFDDVVLSFKRQLPTLFGVATGAVAGIAFPSGSAQYTGGGYDPYLQAPWSRDLGGGWGLGGMFSLFWFTARSSQNPTFQSTFQISRALLPSVDSFFEYVGDYPRHAAPSQVLDAGATWTITHLQSVDFIFGFGLNHAAPAHFVGLGYSVRFDDLF